MKRFRTEEEIDELIALARTYCTELASYRLAQAEGRLSEEVQEQVEHRIARMSEKIELLKSSNELDRKRARTTTTVISMARFKRKMAK